jgi:hypothetical protein
MTIPDNFRRFEDARQAPEAGRQSLLSLRGATRPSKIIISVTTGNAATRKKTVASVKIESNCPGCDSPADCTRLPVVLPSGA